MQTKHFVNNAETLVKAALKSCCILQPELSLDIERKILYAGQHTSTTNQANQVSIISGGGSGHEPSFTGFVGAGFLTACVAGNIFASPSSTQVLKAIESVDGSKGVLVTVMNYTGDVLNFGVAVEKAKTRNPDLNVRMLIVGDDVGVSREKLGKVGRRGIAGTVLVHKITGALAAGGCSLDEVMRVGRLVTDNLASIGVSLNRVHVPGRSLEEGSVDSLGSDEVELGMGIHNEAGSARKSGADASLPSLVQEMLRRLLGRSNTAWSPWQSIPKEVVLLVNNLGGLSVLELGAVVTEISEQLQKDYQLTPARIFAGTFMTSLNGPGFSMSLLNLVDTGTDQSLLDLLDFETMVSGWHAIQKSTDTKKRNIATDFKVSRPHALEIEQRSERRQNMKIITRRLQSGLHAVVASEPEITKYDDIVGDGDCGTTLKRGAEGKSPTTGCSRIRAILTVTYRHLEKSCDLDPCYHHRFALTDHRCRRKYHGWHFWSTLRYLSQ
jgi:dihydroxyacetone kinase